MTGEGIGRGGRGVEGGEGRMGEDPTEDIHKHCHKTDPQTMKMTEDICHVMFVQKTNPQTKMNWKHLEDGIVCAS